MGIEDVLAAARAGVQRLSPQQAWEAQQRGALLVDTRPESQRAQSGHVPGALVVERNVLEWRLDPASPDRVPEATGHDLLVVVLCQQGYSSSLAAESLRRLGLRRATDVVGGVDAWVAAGLPLTRGGVADPD